MGYIFAGADFIDGAGGVFRSTDNGATWTDINQGVITQDVRALAINSNDDIFAGEYFGGGVYRSTDNGSSWIPVDNGLSCTSIWSLAINSDDQIFAGSAGCGDGVFRSTDNGSSWVLVNNGLTSTDISSLAFNSSNDIYAATISQFGMGGGVFRSTDNGENWTEQINGLTIPDIYSLTINSSGHLFAGTSGGIFNSTDNGENWTEINAGLFNLDVRALAVNSEGYVFAGTTGGGVSRSINSSVPVELVSFTSSFEDGKVLLRWETATETNNQGFEVQRLSVNQQAWTSIGFTPGNGTSVAPHSYSFTDGSISPGRYNYRLKQIDFDGAYKYSNIVEVNAVPLQYALEQNFPNPFNPSTTIKFSLAADSKVSLKIYNTLGQEVAELLNGNMTAGAQRVEFNASRLPSGIYLYMLTVNGSDGRSFNSVKKMTLLK